jgi:DNA processing protein
MITGKNKKLLTLRKLDQVGPAALRKISADPSFDSDSISQLASRHDKISKALAKVGALEDAKSAAEKAIASLDSMGATLLSENDSDYPQLLRDAPERPYFLAYLGKLPQTTKSVAVIGTRQPTAHGAIIAERVTAHFSEKGWSVISGLALGCDGVAHKAALDCGGHTVAVLAHGLHTIAPKSHESLAKRILANGGALVTEFVFGEEPIPRYFATRDKTQAGMSRGVIMIQSDLIGGSLHASRASLGYGRILAVPSVTERDLANQEPKTEANRVLVEGSDSQKMELLKCKPQDLNLLFSIRSKGDYEALEQLLLQRSS